MQKVALLTGPFTLGLVPWQIGDVPCFKIISVKQPCSQKATFSKHTLPFAETDIRIETH